MYTLSTVNYHELYHLAVLKKESYERMALSLADVWIARCSGSHSLLASTAFPDKDKYIL